jgi:hypothetical protein
MPGTTPQSTFPAIFGQYSAEEFVIGGGVAIFHIASARVVICSAKDSYGRTYYFLPKVDSIKSKEKRVTKSKYDRVDAMLARRAEEALRGRVTKR